MGVYEIITGITKNEENLKVEIRQTDYVDEIHGSIYEKNYVTDLARLSEHLRKAGIGVPKVTLKLDKMRRREDGMRWN